MSTLYHGNKKIIERPTTDMISFACGFGQGFYLTGDGSRAKEYAISLGEDGYVTTYDIDLDRYNVLDLRSDEYSALSWVGLFAANRAIDVTSKEALEAKRYLIENCAPKGDYDVVIGCRCDGIYTRVATDFINGKLTYRNLCRMLNVGDADIQYAVLSEEVLDDMNYTGSEYVASSEYYPKKDIAFAKKLDAYNKRLNTTARDGDVYVSDIVKEGMR